MRRRSHSTYSYQVILICFRFRFFFLLSSISDLIVSDCHRHWVRFTFNLHVQMLALRTTAPNTHHEPFRRNVFLERSQYASNYFYNINLIYFTWTILGLNFILFKNTAISEVLRLHYSIIIIIIIGVGVWCVRHHLHSHHLMPKWKPFDGIKLRLGSKCIVIIITIVVFISWKIVSIRCV